MTLEIVWCYGTVDWSLSRLHPKRNRPVNCDLVNKEAIWLGEYDHKDWHAFTLGLFQDYDTTQSLLGRFSLPLYTLSNQGLTTLSNIFVLWKEVKKYDISFTVLTTARNITTVGKFICMTVRTLLGSLYVVPYVYLLVLIEVFLIDKNKKENIPATWCFNLFSQHFTRTVRFLSHQTKTVSLRITYDLYRMSSYSTLLAEHSDRLSVLFYELFLRLFTQF